MDAIRSKHPDFFDLPDDTRIDTCANSSNQRTKSLEEVMFDDSESSQQTISKILNLEGAGTQVHRPEGPLIFRLGI